MSNWIITNPWSLPDYKALVKVVDIFGNDTPGMGEGEICERLASPRERP